MWQGWQLWCGRCYFYVIMFFVVRVLSCRYFCLFFFICASRRILFIDEEKIPKKPANSMRATLACLFTCVCIAHVLQIPFKSEKRNPIKLNIAYRIVNFSKL